MLKFDGTYEGRSVYAEWDSSKIQIGDYVVQDIVDDFMDCLPPACYTRRCAQMGEPQSHRVDPNTGNLRATYLTFTHVTGRIWKYCGDCFQGETERRGEDPPYVTCRG